MILDTNNRNDDVDSKDSGVAGRLSSLTPSEFLRKKHGPRGMQSMKTIVGIDTSAHVTVSEDLHVMGALRDGVSVEAGRTLLLDGFVGGTVFLAAGARMSIRGTFSARVECDEGSLRIEGQPDTLSPEDSADVRAYVQLVKRIRSENRKLTH